MSGTDREIRIAVIGSRRYARLDLVRAFIVSLAPQSVIVSGGAPGVDSAAAEAAVEAGLKTLVFPADWDGLGRQAGPIRNAEIVANADRVVAFWDGLSHGTTNTVLQAVGRRLPIELYGPDGEPLPVERALRAARRRP